MNSERYFLSFFFFTKSNIKTIKKLNAIIIKMVKHILLSEEKFVFKLLSVVLSEKKKLFDVEEFARPPVNSKSADKSQNPIINIRRTFSLINLKILNLFFISWQKLIMIWLPAYTAKIMLQYKFEKIAVYKINSNNPNFKGLEKSKL